LRPGSSTAAPTPTIGGYPIPFGGGMCQESSQSGPDGAAWDTDVDVDPGAFGFARPSGSTMDYE
jgi:hypothetical protein